MSTREPWRDLAWELTESPAPEDLGTIRSGLTEHASSWVESPGFQPLAVLARRPDGSLAGGVSGRVNWTWLEISLLWVAPELRGTGFGAALLERLELEAKARGCLRAHLETFGFQARPFYEKAGYEVFATLEDYPPGHRRYYLQKRLDR